MLSRLEWLRTVFTVCLKGMALGVNSLTFFGKAGFEYVTGEYNDGGKIFRKPKYT